MSEGLDEELHRGQSAAQDLVSHMERMGGAAHAEIPVSHIDRKGRLQEWKVTVEVVSIIQA